MKHDANGQWSKLGKEASKGSSQVVYIPSSDKTPPGSVKHGKSTRKDSHGRPTRNNNGKR